MACRDWERHSSRPGLLVVVVVDVLVVRGVGGEGCECAVCAVSFMESSM
jgi:hypothetical protein